MERSLATDVLTDVALAGDLGTLKGGLGAIFGSFLRRRGKDRVFLGGRLGLVS